MGDGGLWDKKLATAVVGIRPTTDERISYHPGIPVGQAEPARKVGNVAKTFGFFVVLWPFPRAPIFQVGGSTLERETLDFHKVRLNRPFQRCMLMCWKVW